MGERMAAYDWERSSLGPVGEWPLSLRTAVRIMLTSRQPMFVWWGEQLINLYNDAYKSIVGGKHPWALGQPASAVWREIWDEVEPRAATAMQTNEGTYDEALMLIMERYGYSEETYYTFSYSPVPNDQGQPGGIICANSEDTARIIQGRQLALLSEVGAIVAEARTISEAAQLAARSLQSGHKDFPFALLYLHQPVGNELQLVGATGIPAGHPLAPLVVDTERPSFWTVEQVAELAEPLVLGLPQWEDLPTGGWSRPPSQAVVAPLLSQGRGGVLVAGLNPFRLFDAGFREFTQLLAGQISACLSNAQAYEEERERAEALAALDKAKTTFFSNISHEFRTPLTLMIGPTEEALASRPAALEGEGLETLHRNQLRLLKLVNALLDFSRLEAGRMAAHFVPTDLGRLTAELAGMFESALQRAGLRYDISCPKGRELVYVDQGMWEKIVLNLLSNALKFTFEGKVEVALEEHDQEVELRVSDTGTGVPAEQVPHLFERFHRVEGARSRTHEGSGIGLAMVHDLVELHGGTVSVQSQEGQGTTFRVRLKKGYAHLDPQHVSQIPQEPTVSALQGRSYLEEVFPGLEVSEAPRLDPVESAAEDGRPRVVVADDNADMRNYIQRILASRYQVFCVPDGLKALQVIEQRMPDLLLTDVMMPELDGFGLLDEVRRRYGARELPVIMLSARAGEESRVEGIEAGADDYLVKPFSAKELLARAEAHIELGRLRRQIEHERAAYERVFDSSPLPVAVMRGRDQIFDLANQPYRRLTGNRPLVGRPLLEAMPELAGQGFSELLLEVMDTGVPYVGEEAPVKLDRQGDGRLDDTYWTFVYAPLDVGKGGEPCVVVLASEVTADVLARESLTALANEAHMANRAKDEFLAMLGHELRNPLSPILTALELMKLRGSSSREQAVIERQVQHLVRLVDDLLDISRITSGKVTLKTRPVELVSIVVAAVETASPLFQQRAQRLELEVPEHGLVSQLDVGRMTQVLSNLLTNASKYSGEGTTIRVHARREGQRAHLVVKDQGNGIASEMLVRIFDLFAQERQSLDRSQGGLGLGLAIVKNLVEMHGGQVSARSEGPGLGSEFELSLPLCSDETLVQGADSSGTSTMSWHTRPWRVMVVDDNRDAADMLAVGLTATGYEVQVAHDGLAALSLAEAFQPDAALLDLGLPVMDGFELARRLRAGYLTEREAPVLVAVTGYGLEQDRESSRQAGFEDHMAKPVSIADVRAVLERLRAARDATV